MLQSYFQRGFIEDKRKRRRKKGDVTQCRGVFLRLSWRPSQLSWFALYIWPPYQPMSSNKDYIMSHCNKFYSTTSEISQNWVNLWHLFLSHIVLVFRLCSIFRIRYCCGPFIHYPTLPFVHNCLNPIHVYPVIYCLSSGISSIGNNDFFQADFVSISNSYHPLILSETHLFVVLCF